MTTRTSLLFVLALVSALAAGCVVADEGADEASLVEAEGYAKALVVRPLDPPPPGTQSASLELSAPDRDGLVESRLQICKVAGTGGVGVYCDVWYCESHAVGVDNHCEWTCGWSCEGTLDECDDVGNC